MSWQVKRVSPRKHLCTTNDGDAIVGLHGTAIVWWYERNFKNEHAQSIPYTEVVFKYLDKFDRPAGVHVAKIGISRLGSFRLGTIWQGGKCVAETHLGRDRVFSVDFTDGRWSYLSVLATPQFKFFQQDYELRTSPGKDVHSHLLNFPLADERNLLVPCVEFLYRCYGATSDMARVLTTYRWPEVLDRLYERRDHDPSSRLVQPKPYIPDSDAPFLAAVQYDRYTELAARDIHAQLDAAYGAGKPKSLKVAPWFQGHARIRVRGRWINGGKTFLALEVTGLSEPQHPYELRRMRQSEQDLVTGVPLVNLQREIVDKPIDPFPITDLEEPGNGASTWNKKDPAFERIPPKCPYVRSYTERAYSERKTVTIPEGTADKSSTGDINGQPNDINHLSYHANRIEGDGGIVKAMWNELLVLKSSTPGFTSLAWYSSKNQQFVETSDCQLQQLPSFKNVSIVPSLARTWLYYKGNPDNRRGMLVVKITVHKRTFYLLELQRKKIRNKKVFEDEKFSGLLVNIDDPSQARETLSFISDRIRYCLGRFTRVKIDAPLKVFRHHTVKGAFLADVTVRRAFEALGVDFTSRP